MLTVNQESNTITIDERSTVAWGLFNKSTGGLVRQLGFKEFDSGTHKLEWDGKDINGNIILYPNLYSIKAIVHKIVATPVSGIENSSSQLEGFSRFSSYYDVASCIAFTPDKQNMIMGLRYTEATRGQVVINVADYGSRSTAPVFSGWGQPSLFCAATNTTYYWACWTDISMGGSRQYFIMGINRNTLEREVFQYGQTSTHIQSNGEDISCGGLIINSSYKSNEGVISGFCIYNNFAILSRINLNRIEVYDLDTFQLLQTLSINSPEGLTSDIDGIWLIREEGTKISKLLLDGDGIPSITNLTINGQYIKSAAIINDELVLVESGDQQRPRGYNRVNGEIVWDDFTKDGFSTSSILTNRNFLFTYPYLETDLNSPNYLKVIVKDNPVDICSNADEGFSIIDASNNRIQFYDSNRQFIRSISYLASTYYTHFIGNSSKDIIAGFNRYYYNDNSWIHTHNYTYSIYNLIESPNIQLGLHNIWKDENSNKIFACIQENNVGIREVELKDDGLILVDTIPDKREYNYFISRNSISNKSGSLYRYKPANIGDRLIIEESKLATITTEGNIIRSSFSQVLKTSILNENTLFNPSELMNSVSNGLITLFEPFAPDLYNQNTRKGPHLLTYKLTEDQNTISDPYWSNAYATPSIENYIGLYPTNGDFDIRSVYPGGTATIEDNFIAWNHHGEFDFNTGQTNKHHLIYADLGLPLVIMGWPDGIPFTRTVKLGEGGNAQNNSIQRISSDRIDLICGDESTRGEIIRFTITGISTIEIVELKAEIYIINSSFQDLLVNIPKSSSISSIPGWSIYPTNSSIGWIIRSNAKTLPKDNPDIYLKLDGSSIVGSSINTPCMIERDLTVNGINNNQVYIPKDWKISMVLSTEGGLGVPNQNLKQELLDESGKVILRIARRLDYSNFPNNIATLTINGIDIFNEEFGRAIKILLTPLPLLVERIGDSIKVTYHTYTSMIVDKADPSSDVDKPKIWRISAYSEGNNEFNSLSLQDFKINSMPMINIVDGQLASDRLALIQLSTSNITHYNNGGSLLIRVKANSQHDAGPYVIVNKIDN